MDGHNLYKDYLRMQFSIGIDCITANHCLRVGPKKRKPVCHTCIRREVIEVCAVGVG